MATIIQKACAGTLESSDVYVEVEPCVHGIDFTLDSAVIEQFGESIRNAVFDTLEKKNITEIKIKLVDRGALDCVIRARVETAVNRGSEKQNA